MLSVRGLVALTVLALAAFVSAQNPPLPSFPATYTMTGTFSIPYFNITEPVYSAYDGTNNRQYISYYGEMVQVLLLPTNGYQLVYEDSVPSCMAGQGSSPLVNMFPKVDNTWSYKGTELVNGQTCNKWELVVKNSANHTSVYDFLVLANDNTVPVQYRLYGYNTLFGSHFDHYIMDYHEFAPNFVNASLFNLPTLCHTATPSALGSQSIARQTRTIGSIFTSAETSKKFSDWASKYGKNYAEHREMLHRQRVFHENHHFVETFSQLKRGFKVALNHFADVSVEEFMSTVMPKKWKELGYDGTNKAQATHKLSGRDLPQNVDWRQKLPAGAITVKDQGSCGSCWSFSSSGALEAAYTIATGRTVSVSEQQFVDCSWHFQNNGCDGGMQSQAYDYLLAKGRGIMSESDYPYLMQDGNCHVDPSRVVVNITSYTNITMYDEKALMDALANVGPAAVSIDAAHQSFMFYDSGVYVEPDCKYKPEDLDHAVLAVGYGTLNGQDYWLVKNSWSTWWGNQGYVLMSRANGGCGVQTAALYPLVN